MHQHRFDAFARALVGSRSRRETVSLLGAVAGLLALEPIAILGTQAQGEICLTGDERCRRGSQCCSGECKKKRRKNGKKKRGKCVSLGQFAANCPPTDVCNLSIPPNDQTECHVGDVIGTCTVSPSGGAFCARTSQCNTGQAICSTDADCAAELEHPDAKCFPCGQPCFGNVACVIYAGDADLA
jgi:hypothetical protein